MFDAGSGNKIKDSSDNGNHGNLVNIPEWGNFPKTKPLDAKKWYHIVVAADAKTKTGKQSVDGELISEIDYTTGRLGDFAFAKMGRQGTETWEGSIDEVTVFD